MSTNDDGGMEWLGDLEETVRRAAEDLAELRREREELRVRVEQLEKAGPPSDGDSGDREAWHEERVEIRRRVESLTDRLEGLLADDSD